MDTVYETGTPILKRVYIVLQCRREMLKLVVFRVYNGLKLRNIINYVFFLIIIFIILKRFYIKNNIKITVAFHVHGIFQFR